MNKLKQLLTTNKDKVYHFTLSYVIMLTLLLFTTPYSAAMVTFVIGIGKELYDEFDYGGFSIPDLIADFAGVLLAAGFFSLSGI